MPLFSARSMLRAVAAAATLAAGALPAAAQSYSDTSDVYIAAFKDSAKPIVVFVFSDASTKEMKEIDATAFFPKPDYAVPEGERFDPTQACLVTFDFSVKDVPSNFKLNLKSAPIYGPNSTQTTIDPFSLPSYMARETAKILLENKLVADQAAATPYFNCAGYIWSQIINQPPEFWEKTYKELIEEEKKKKGK